MATHRPIALLALALVACGGTPISATPPGDAGAPGDVPAVGAPIAIEQVGPALTSAACDALFRCTFSGDNASVRLIFGSPQACAAGVQRLGNADLTDLQRAVREGRVRYDAAAAGRCLDAVRSRCDVNLSLDELCADVFQGTIAVGGQCYRHEECAGDAYCQGTAGMCPGVCRPRLAAGAACQSNAQCSPGGSVPARCVSGDTGGSRCVRLTNGPAAAEGAACGVIVAAGASAGQKVACAVGLYCQSASNGGTCQRPLPANAPCRSGDACEGSAICTGGMCRVASVATTAGAACNTAALQACSPVANLTCTGGACALVGSGAAGSACMGGDLYDTFGCDDGLYCDRAAMRCAARRAAGATCTTNRECASEECANGRCLDRQCNLAE